MNAAFNRFVARHQAANSPLRLGQAFVNIYIKEPWPELFHEPDDKYATVMIEEYLDRHHYYDVMPIPVQELPDY